MTNANDEARGLVRGVALNPGTPIEALAPLMDQLELITILAVNPGWGGQGFASHTAERLEAARALIAASGRDVLLCVDGGITAANCAEVTGLGPDLIVTGSAVFDGVAPAENAQRMLAAVASARA
jgi:ribulose-phosphate 3-epimerase